MLKFLLRDSIGTASLAWRKEGGLMPIGATMVNGGQVRKNIIKLLNLVICLI